MRNFPKHNLKPDKAGTCCCRFPPSNAYRLGQRRGERARRAENRSANFPGRPVARGGRFSGTRGSHVRALSVTSHRFPRVVSRTGDPLSTATPVSLYDARPSIVTRKARRYDITRSRIAVSYYIILYNISDKVWCVSCDR